MSLYQLLATAVIVLNCSCFLLKKLTLNFNGLHPILIGIGRKPYGAYCCEIIYVTVGICNLISQITSIFLFNTLLFHDTWLKITGVVLFFLGTALYIASLITLKASWRVGTDYNEHPKLIREGIYRFLRNPGFLGMDFIGVGMFLIFPNYLLLLTTAAMIVTLHIQIIFEENYLTGIHGERYIRYKKRTRRYV